MAAVTNDAKMRRRTIDIRNPQWLGPAIRINHVGLSTRDDDKIALGHLDFLSLSERERRRALAEIVKQRVRACRQLEMPGMADLEVKEQRPTETNSFVFFGVF